MQFVAALAFLGALVSFCDASPLDPVVGRDVGSSSKTIDAICKGSPAIRTCKRTVNSKCYFKHLTGASAAVCKCKESVAGVSPIYAKWVKEQNAGNDKCAASPDVVFPEVHKGPGGEKPTSFNDFLISADKALADKFKCCFGTEVGLFDPKGAPILTAWQQHASKVSDASSLKAVQDAINGCPAKVTTCSAHDFMDCVMRSCYQSISA